MSNTLLKIPGGAELVKQGWELAGFGMTRDSDPLEISNFHSAAACLLPTDNLERTPGHTMGDLLPDAAYADDDATAAVHRVKHWAVGWVDEILVKTNTIPALIAKDLREKLEDYPVVNEHHYCETEYNFNHPDDGYCYDYECECELDKG